MKNIMVFIEQVDGKISDVSLELTCEAVRLQQKLGNVEVESLLLGGSVSQKEIEKLAHYGSQRIVYVQDDRLAHYTSLPYAKASVEMIKKYQPQIVLFGATVNGRDLAPRVASSLKCGLTADCTELDIGECVVRKETFSNTLLQIRPAFGGNIIATIVSPESSPSMASVREGVMNLYEPDVSKKADIILEKISFNQEDFATELIEFIKRERTVNLKGANIIVTAGMGVSDQESLTLIKELAKTLGGTVGATRPVVDAGLLSHEHQIGQTGVTVRPTLYIACGVSGQIQHRAGMSESKRIIAINADPNAPIFEIANYGIVGDLKEVIPKMIQAYKNIDQN
jgi:electron transfer flavoprotein alpha subunit